MGIVVPDARVGRRHALPCSSGTYVRTCMHAAHVTGATAQWRGGGEATKERQRGRRAQSAHMEEVDTHTLHDERHERQEGYGPAAVLQQQVSEKKKGGGCRPLCIEPCTLSISGGVHHQVAPPSALKSWLPLLQRLSVRPPPLTVSAPEKRRLDFRLDGIQPMRESSRSQRLRPWRQQTALLDSRSLLPLLARTVLSGQVKPRTVCSLCDAGGVRASVAHTTQRCAVGSAWRMTSGCQPSPHT